MSRVTIFTATYNYGKYLHRVYNSLLEQSCLEFEWLIVDDCSTDDTGEIVQSWIDDNQSNFDIRYYRQDVNQGKMAAMNRGAQLATYELFISVDADDELKPEAVERFLYHWDAISISDQSKIGVLCSLCETQFGKIAGLKLPQSPLICDYYDYKFKYHMTGERLNMYQTKVLREYPFYDKVDRHVIHSATYFDISEKYLFYFFNEVLRIWYVDEPDKIPLSLRTRKLRYIKGRHFYAEKRINVYFDKIKSMKFKFLTYLSYIRYSHHNGIYPIQQIKNITRGSRAFLCFLILPLGYLIILQDLIRKRV